MELTKHEIHRIFALYWGCDAIEDGETGKVYVLDELSCPDDVEWGTPYGPRLILRPLSKVTDEDAIEVAKIMGMPANAEILKIYRDRESWIEIEYRWVNEVAELNNEDGYSYSATGVPIREVGHAVPFQFLIQRGYAVPLFIAPGHLDNGKTAIELGLAIERKD